MLRNKFQKELELLGQELLGMVALIERIIGESSMALTTQDKVLCEKVIAYKDDVNILKAEIESKALKIILMQQPVASDLRKISTALKMIIDLERIAGQARDICEIVFNLCEENYQIKLEILPQMAELTRQMVYDCVNSFVKQDLELAAKTIETDDLIDNLFDKLKQKMIKLIKEKPSFADQAIYLLMVGKHLEKIGDHAENIAEWVIYSKTGKHKNIKII
ncbi:MAG: phosphate signaling complex protein PhoU [Erysipelotrichales bacterium]|nr:phosphate signaling complex protein PhoU [Erysipelotrichales bacterium]